jgi:hypothetical protein
MLKSLFNVPKPRIATREAKKSIAKNGSLELEKISILVTSNMRIRNDTLNIVAAKECPKK